MQLSYSQTPHNQVDYYPLPNNRADVFLRRNEIISVNKEKETVYVAEEVYFQVDQSTTKEYIENNFDLMWQNSEKVVIVPTQASRIDALENALLALM